MRFDKLMLLGSVAVLVLAMGAATVIGKLLGNEAAFSAVYHNPLFIALWAIAAVSGFVWLLHRKVQKRPVVFLLHISLLLILAGALATHLTSRKGTVALEIGQTVESPVKMTLDDFKVVFYPGTDTPMDYESSLTLEGGEKAVISMNRILKAHGYRFFQRGYMDGEQGTIFSWTYDPWGTGITYAGYFLLFFCLLAFFLCRDTGFRAAVKRLSAPAAALLLFLLPANARAEEVPKAFPKDVADELGKVEVYYNGRICPLQTLARDYCLKVYGRTSVKGFSCEQVLSGWMFYYDTWKDIPVKCKKKDRGTAKEDEKHWAISSVASGRAIKIFPCRTQEGNVVWYSPAEKLPGDLGTEEWTFMKKVVSMVGEDVFLGDCDNARKTLCKLQEYQMKKAGDVIPSSRAIRAERIYNSIALPKIPFMFCITLGIVLFIFSGFSEYDRARKKAWWKAGMAVISVGMLVYLTSVIALRWYVSGHLPMANGHEMMMAIAWFAMLVTAFSGGKFHLLQPLGFILAGFALLVASLGQSNPQISPLMPVLSSPLLSVHVGCMMISYTLFGLVALNGIMGLAVRDSEKKKHRADLGLVVLYPATFLLTAGTFIGAIWANVSWGSYWAWDPKETWALITCLIYAAALHSQTLPSLKKPAVFHTFCIVAFLSVLITYFGVNYLLGGMHSYA